MQDEYAARVEREQPAVRKMRRLEGDPKRSPEAKRTTRERKKTRRLKHARNVGFDGQQR